MLVRGNRWKIRDEPLFVAMRQEEGQAAEQLYQVALCYTWIEIAIRRYIRPRRVDLIKPVIRDIFQVLRPISESPSLVGSGDRDRGCRRYLHTSVIDHSD